MIKEPVSQLAKISFAAAVVGVLGVVIGLALGQPDGWRAAAVIVAVAIAIAIGGVPALRGYQFTLWIVAAVVAGMVIGPSLLRWGEVDLRNKWLILVVVQLVMFGMGTQMSLRDFAGVMKMPWAVLIAMAGQFTIMPLVGWGLTRMFLLPDEIAAGVILIGSCSSGLASNVMCYIARANLALSITATAVATLLAPLMTPLWMKLLAGTLVEVKFLNMMIEIVKIVVVPVGAALLHDYLKHASPRGRRIVHVLVAASAVVVTLIVARLGGASGGGTGQAALILELVGFLCGAVIAGWAYHRLTRSWSRVATLMPALSMAGIIYFTTVTTAAGRDNLAKVGAVLFCVAVLHNVSGYLLGYGLARAAGLDKNSARTIAFEVGLQNGGMASGLAGAMGKLGTVGLAAAIFSPWMNISGSVLANWWKRNESPSPAAR